MDIRIFNKVNDFTWRIEPVGNMRVPAIIYADEALITAMDDKVREQICNVAMLPGIVEAAYAMPDAHWGYGFPIGGVAACHRVVVVLAGRRKRPRKGRHGDGRARRPLFFTRRAEGHTKPQQRIQKRKMQMAIPTFHAEHAHSFGRNR